MHVQHHWCVVLNLPASWHTWIKEGVQEIVNHSSIIPSYLVKATKMHTGGPELIFDSIRHEVLIVNVKLRKKLWWRKKDKRKQKKQKKKKKKKHKNKH